MEIHESLFSLRSKNQKQHNKKKLTLKKLLIFFPNKKFLIFREIELSSTKIIKKFYNFSKKKFLIFLAPSLKNLLCFRMEIFQAQKIKGILSDKICYVLGNGPFYI